MSLNLYQQGLLHQLINDVAALKQSVHEMRTNQVKLVKYGNITINGTSNQITLGNPVSITLDQTGYLGIKNSSAQEIIRFNDTGMHIKTTAGVEQVLVDATGIHVKNASAQEISLVDFEGYKLKTTAGEEIVRLDQDGINIKTTGTSFVHYIRFFKSGVVAGRISFVRYTPGSHEVSDMIFSSIFSSASNRAAYASMSLYDQGGSRQSFLQISETFTGGTFADAGLNYARTGYTGSLVITIDNVNGDGFMLMPRRSGDPAGGGGRMYYNTSTNKVRVHDGGVWKDVA